MSRDLQITFDAHDPRSQSRFWAAALGYLIPGPPGVDLDSWADPFDAWDAFLERMGVPASEWNSRSAAEDPGGTGARLFFQRVPEEKTVKNRVHLDVRGAPGLAGDERMAALEAACAELEALGATRVRRQDPDPPMEGGYIVLTDPEDNEFCLD
ncbi:VOC family protein [Gordonia zhaorongruii]|uniref:VOC family protein n=1 Tax=Gordonia zhaorongruii TaxID=2597659 RepID=UPI001052FDD1|nr:VOC family protein [Gordonia zhaorongruii]